MSQATILLIEDDADIREGIRILLESENYSVLEANNGRAGLELLTNYVDLIILDIMMPGISGLKTCEEIRKISYVPILFLTAKSSESDKLLGLMAGGDDYLAKPFSYAELLGRVKALLRRYQVYSGKGATNQQTDKDTMITIRNICINENFNIHFFAQLFVFKNQDSLHNNNICRVNHLKITASVVNCVIINWAVDWLTIF